MEMYDELLKQHPDWSDEQIWTAISIKQQADTTIEAGGKDIDPEDPSLWGSILEGAKKWLREVLPDLYEKVAALFNYIRENIGEWVKKGLDYLWKLIGEWGEGRLR